MSWVVAIALALTVFVGYLWLVRLGERKEMMRERMERMTASGGAGLYGPDEDGTPKDVNLLTFDEERSSLARLLEGMLLLTGANLDKIRKDKQMELTQAGIVTMNGLIYYLFLKRIGVPLLALGLAVPVFAGFTSPTATTLLKVLYGFLGVLLVILAFKGTDLFILNYTIKRKKELVRSFPDALDLLLVCVESGLALDGALQRVCRELGRAHPEITLELNRTRLELTLLNDRTQALMNLGDRTGVVAFRSLVSALIQSEKFGTSLSDTLRVLSEDYRLTRLMLAEQKAGRLPVLMTIPLILLMLPAFVMIILGPPIIRVIAQGGLFGNQ